SVGFGSVQMGRHSCVVGRIRYTRRCYRRSDVRKAKGPALSDAGSARVPADGISSVRGLSAAATAAVGALRLRAVQPLDFKAQLSRARPRRFCRGRALRSIDSLGLKRVGGDSILYGLIEGRFWSI